MSKNKNKKGTEQKAVYERFCIFRDERTKEEIPAFKLNNKRHELFMSVPTMLELLETAVKKGSLPHFSDKWIVDVRKRYLTFYSYSDGDFE